MRDTSPKISLHALIKEFYNKKINLIIEQIEDISVGYSYDWIIIKDLREQLEVDPENEIWYGINQGKLIFVKGDLFKEIIANILNKAKANENTIQTTV